jgi:hypothetical protein
MTFLVFFLIFSRFYSKSIFINLKKLKIMARVIIPENPDQLIELIQNALQKEQELAPNSTLTPDQLAELNQLYETANKDNADQKDLYRQAEELTRSRDNALGLNLSVNQPNTAKYLITSLRDILLAKNKTNPKALGAWGFTVDDSPRKKDEPPTP